MADGGLNSIFGSRAIALAMLVAFVIPTLADGPSSPIPTNAPASVETRIVFKRGAIDAVATGGLTEVDDQVRFVVRARSGQHMRLTVDADGPTRGFVTFPTGG